MKMKHPAKSKGKSMMKGPEPKMPSPGKMMKGEASQARAMMADKPVMPKRKDML
jgi:hypothetical protein